jgi:hypothetical protein
VSYLFSKKERENPAQALVPEDMLPAPSAAGRRQAVDLYWMLDGSRSEMGFHTNIIVPTIGFDNMPVVLVLFQYFALIIETGSAAQTR